MNPRDELASAQRLFHEVVSPCGQPYQQVELAGARRDHHDVAVSGVPEPPAHLDAVDTRQVEIEHHDVRVDQDRRDERALARSRQVDVEPFEREVVSHDRSKVLLVVDHERAHHGWDRGLVIGKLSALARGRGNDLGSSLDIFIEP